MNGQPHPPNWADLITLAIALASCLFGLVSLVLVLLSHRAGRRARLTVQALEHDAATSVTIVEVSFLPNRLEQAFEAEIRVAAGQGALLAPVRGGLSGDRMFATIQAAPRSGALSTILPLHPSTHRHGSRDALVYVIGQIPTRGLKLRVKVLTQPLRRPRLARTVKLTPTI